MTSTPPTSLRQLREGKIAKSVRIFITLTMIAAFIGRIVSVRPAPEIIGVYGLSFFLTWALLQLIATIIIWIFKLLAYGVRHGA